MRPRQAATARATVLAITSGKGGVGKTNVTINVAIAMARLGLRVGVLREAGLPISYVGTGQRVPEDLHRATPPAIAAWVLGDHHLEGAIA